MRQIQDFGQKNVESNDINTQRDDKQHIIETKYFSDQTLCKNEKQDNEEVVPNTDNEIISEDNTNLDSKIISNQNNSELEDNDSDYDINDQQISDNSDEECNERQPKTKSKTTEKSTNGSFMCTINNCSRSFKSHNGLRTHQAIVHKKKRDLSSSVGSNKVFRCDFKDCSAVFAKKYRLNRHQLIHKKLKCNLANCGHTSRLYSSLLQHRRKSHPNHMPFQCCLNECDNSFKTQILLRKHQTNDHNIGCQPKANCSINGSFHCSFDNCTRSFTTYIGFTVHEAMVHLKNDSGVYRCDFEGCSQTFKTRQTYIRHRARHTGEYSCDVEGCDHITVSSRDLKVHKQRIHSNERPFKCPQKDCDKNFKTFNDMRTHFKTHPNIDETVFVCEHSNCGKVFWQMNALEKHQATYHSKNSQKYMCDHNGCGKQFKHNFLLKRHKSGHLESINGVFNCSYKDCGRSFDSVIGVKSHESRVHQNASIGSHNSNAVFRCEWKDCSRLFSSKNNLNRHLVIHKGIHRCGWNGCQYNASSPHKLKVHKAMHFTQEQFKCQINGCDKQFRIAKQREWHQLREHPNEFNDVPWIECKVSHCSYKTKNREALSKHDKQVHPLHTYACEWFRM